VALASRGLRDLDSGPQEITEADIQAQVKKQASAVQLKSLISAAVPTALSLLI
jgi:hypothetical protein